jgi:hypothetical protein
MKQILLGFILGIVVCMSLGAALYQPLRGVVVDARPEATLYNLKTIMENQEAIYHLIEARCKSGAPHE